MFALAAVVCCEVVVRLCCSPDAAVSSALCAGPVPVAAALSWAIPCGSGSVLGLCLWLSLPAALGYSMLPSYGVFPSSRAHPWVRRAPVRRSRPVGTACSRPAGQTRGYGVLPSGGADPSTWFFSSPCSVLLGPWLFHVCFKIRSSCSKKNLENVFAFVSLVDDLGTIHIVRDAARSVVGTCTSSRLLFLCHFWARLPLS